MIQAGQCSWSWEDAQGAAEVHIAWGREGMHVLQTPRHIPVNMEGMVLQARPLPGEDFFSKFPAACNFDHNFVINFVTHFPQQEIGDHDFES